MNLNSNIQLSQLLYFVEAVECGSLLKAAEKLRLSQPAITTSIRKLEKLLDVELLERSRRGVKLTAYGKVFHQHALNVISELNAGVSILELEKTQVQSQIALGVLPIATEALLTIAISAFKKHHPDVAVTVEPGVSNTLSPKLQLNELDMVVGYSETLEHEPAFRFEPLYMEKLCLVARFGHPLQPRKRVALKKLNQYEWFIPYPYSEYRRHVINIFTASRHDYPKNSLSASYHLAKSYLMHSDAVALLPFDFVHQEIKDKKLAEISADFELPKVGTGFAIAGDRQQSDTLKAFILQLRRATYTLISQGIVLRDE